MKDYDVAPQWLDPLEEPSELKSALGKARVYDYVRGLANTMGYPDVFSALMALGKLRDISRQIVQQELDEQYRQWPHMIQDSHVENLTPLVKELHSLLYPKEEQQ
jgi:hypothetical protein